MHDTSRILRNTPSGSLLPQDLSSFHPEVKKSLERLRLLRDGISLEPILKRIAGWSSPLEQVFYVTFLYLKISKRIDPKIRIEEQYRVASGGRWYFVDFRLTLADEVIPDLPPVIGFVECDSRAFHDRTPEELTEDRQRWRELQRQGAKVYPFSGKELFKNPAMCVVECVKDIQRDLFTRREMLMQIFL